MSKSRISAALRRLVMKRAAGCCEFCGIRIEEVLLPHEADHAVAEQHGGKTEAENLCLACFQCNKLKGPNLAGIDPVTGSVEVLFHPRLDDWNAHFAFEGVEIKGKTPRGRATVHTLRLNSAERLRVRGLLTESGRVFG